MSENLSEYSPLYSRPSRSFSSRLTGILASDKSDRGIINENSLENNLNVLDVKNEQSEEQIRTNKIKPRVIKKIAKKIIEEKNENNESSLPMSYVSLSMLDSKLNLKDDFSKRNNRFNKNNDSIKDGNSQIKHNLNTKLKFSYSKYDPNSSTDYKPKRRKFSPDRDFQRVDRIMQHKLISNQESFNLEKQIEKIPITLTNPLFQKNSQNDNDGKLIKNKDIFNDIKKNKSIYLHNDSEIKKVNMKNKSTFLQNDWEVKKENIKNKSTFSQNDSEVKKENISNKPIYLQNNSEVKKETILPNTKPFKSNIMSNRIGLNLKNDTLQAYKNNLSTFFDKSNRNQNTETPFEDSSSGPFPDTKYGHIKTSPSIFSNKSTIDEEVKLTDIPDNVDKLQKIDEKINAKINDINKSLHLKFDKNVDKSSNNTENFFYKPSSSFKATTKLEENTTNKIPNSELICLDKNEAKPSLSSTEKLIRSLHAMQIDLRFAQEGLDLLEVQLLEQEKILRDAETAALKREKSWVGYKLSIRRNIDVFVEYLIPYFSIKNIINSFIMCIMFLIFLIIFDKLINYFMKLFMLKPAIEGYDPMVVLGSYG